MHCTCVKGEGKGKSCHITCAWMKSEQKVKHFTLLNRPNTNKRKQSTNNAQGCLHEFQSMYFWLCFLHRPCGPLGYFRKRKQKCSNSILFNHKATMIYLSLTVSCITSRLSYYAKDSVGIHIWVFMLRLGCWTYVLLASNDFVILFFLTDFYFFIFVR